MQTFEIETMPAFYRSFLDTSHVEWRFLVFLFLAIFTLSSLLKLYLGSWQKHCNSGTYLNI